MKVIKVEFHKPGKGQTNYRTTLRDLIKDTVIKTSFKEKDGIHLAIDVEEKEVSFSHRERDQLVFMQAGESIYTDIAGIPIRDRSLLMYARGRVLCRMIIQQGNVLRVVLPDKLKFRVASSDTCTRRSDTISPAQYLITLEGSLKIKAPHFIQKGDIVWVETSSQSYLRRIYLEEDEFK